MGTDTGEPRFVGSNSSPGLLNNHRLINHRILISSIAISIAVVSSCGEPSQADNRLVVIPTPAFVGSDGVSKGYDYEYFGLDYLPDAYYIGLAGVCRDRDHHVTCVRHFPSRFNLTNYITADLDNSTLIERWDALFHKQAYPYEGLVAKLSTAAGALLVCSILVGTISTVVIMCSKSGFSSSAIILLILDSAMLLAALCLWSSVFFIDFSINNGLGDTWAGGYLLQVIGLGSWLMLAAFLLIVGARYKVVASHAYERKRNLERPLFVHSKRRHIEESPRRNGPN
ncbi:uncharacterized protein K441DRAFT_694284 [Cenococcum geophilum 1.58]|uniref:uncharacterized protein n=1 Tax=Cenococcum geophilum 1.58 TaxID=794803 RepID=UPI00358FA951|nr:hypothetical protein K441DRAFT_694284 [Cenococcum geophilum 1.58]